MKRNETTDFEEPQKLSDELRASGSEECGEEIDASEAEDAEDEEEKDEAEDDVPTDPTDDDGWQEANRNIRNGLLWCAGGILFSFLSYVIAVEGGRYFVATGAVVWGAVQMLRGFFARMSLQRGRGDRGGLLRTAGAAAASLVLIVGLASASYMLAHANDVTFEHEAQIYENEVPNVRFIVPGGYSPLERTDEPETDEAYAYHRMHSFSDNSAVGLEMCGIDPADGITTVDEVLDGLRGQDSTFFDAGLLLDPELVTIGGTRMLRRVGRRSSTPGLVSVTYDLIHDNSVITFYYYYEGEAPEENELRIADALAGSVELR